MKAKTELKDIFFCGCPASGKINAKMVKIGFYASGKGKIRQRYKCQFCGRTETAHLPDDIITIKIQFRVVKKIYCYNADWGIGIEGTDQTAIWTALLDNLVTTASDAMEQVECDSCHDYVHETHKFCHWCGAKMKPNAQ